jgi:hypothetical protein
MALIQLRECQIQMLDGLAGTAKIGDGAGLTGAYLYKYTYTTNEGETTGSPEAASVTAAGQAIVVKVEPNLDNATGIKIYRTAAGGMTGTEHLVVTLSAAATEFVDNVADGSLGAAIPTSNTAGINAPVVPTVTLLGTAPATTDTGCEVNTVSLNTKVTNQIPVGARFQLSTVGNDTTVFTVQGRTPLTGATTAVTFTPAFGSPAPANNDTMNFLPQVLTIKIGEGDIKFTEKKQYQYVLDRGNLDTVREQDQQPMEVNIDCQYQFITTGTGETISPVDALKNEGAASEWVTSSADPCEPYAIDVRLVHTPPCNGTEIETVLFPDFRRDSVAYDPKAATITIAGKCNAMEPTVTRSTTAPI